MRLVCNGAEPCFYDSHKMFLDRFVKWGLPKDCLGIVYGMAEVTNSVFGAGHKEPIQVDPIDRDRLQSEHLLELRLGLLALGDVQHHTGDPLGGVGRRGRGSAAAHRGKPVDAAIGPDHPVLSGERLRVAEHRRPHLLNRRPVVGMERCQKRWEIEPGVGGQTEE